MKTKVFETKDKLEISEAVYVIALAVENDPNKVYYFPNAQRRREHTKFIIGKLFKVSEKNSRVFICKADSIVVGAAMWFQPGYEMSVLSLIKNGLLKLPFLFGFTTFIKMMQSISISDKLKATVTEKKKHWQLFYLGVHPDYQNNGYGALLLAPILEESDQSGIPVFLENFTEANTRFYERNGFEVKSLYSFDKDIEMRNMIRKPGAVYKKIPHKKEKSSKE